MAASPFIVDPRAAALADGTAGPVWGVNANLLSPPPAALQLPYNRLASALTAALSADGGLYVYPYHALHVTLASPAPFTDTRITGDPARAACAAAWRDALRDFSLPPFDVTLERLELQQRAAFFVIADPSGGVERLRDAFRNALRLHPALVALGTLATEDACFRCPAIVHTTVARFAAPSTLPPEEVRQRFDAVADSWGPVTLRVDSVVLVEEAVPYMHLRLDGEDADRILCRVYLTDGQPLVAPSLAPC